MSLNGKSILITGASGGIGVPLCHALQRQGARLLVISRDPQLPFEKAELIQGDLSTLEGIELVTSQLHSHIIDLFISLAGMSYAGTIEDQSAESISRLYHINLMAPILLTRALLPYMKQHNQGHIIHIGSTFGAIPFGYFASYSSSKSGLWGFTEALRRELVDSAIHVTYIAPRAVNTPMNTSKIRTLAQRTHMTMDDPKWVAECIIDAILKHKKEVYLGFPEKIFVYINALFPRLIDYALKNNNRIAKLLFTSHQQEK
jgi:short-subunit dehydrogenase